MLFVLLAVLAADLPKVDTVGQAGSADGLSVEVKVQGPANQRTPLQIVCVFEYVEGDLTSESALPHDANGLLHLDESLKGLITELRMTGRFSGHLLETLLITPPKGSILAEKLLLIGVGDRKTFGPSVMKDVGLVGMREALRLGVKSYTHASDVKDAGVNAPGDAVAQNVVNGARDALRTQRFLAAKKVSPEPSVKSMTLLAGPPFFESTLTAVKQSLLQ